MDTEMLIGGAIRRRHRKRRDGPQPQDRRVDPRPARGVGRADRRAPSRGAAEAFARLVAHDAGRALRLPAADRRRGSRREAEAFAALEALNCGKPINAAHRTTKSRPSSTASASSPARCARMHGPVAGEYLPGHTSMIRRDPDRRRRLDRAVELPADDDGLEARPGHRRRQHGGVQAIRTDAADRAEARPHHGRGSCPKGVVNVVARARRDAWATR